MLKEPTTISMKPELKNAIKKMADDANRTFNNQVETILLEKIAQENLNAARSELP